MGILTDWITEWLRGLLIDGIMGNLEGLFTNLNNRVGEIAVEVGTSPATWNAGVFSLIRQAFRNGCIANSRDRPHLCHVLRADSNAHRPEQSA